MRKLLVCAFWSLGLLACGTPPPPGALPEDSSPPVERAASCPPVARFANAWFHIGDLEQGISCPAYLEQDECVLSVFDDCTARGSNRRQWIGDLSPDGVVSLRATSNNGQLIPREGCLGQLDAGPPARVDLRCGNQEKPHVGMVLEAVEDPATTFGDLEPAFVVAKIEAGLGVIDNDIFSDMLLIDQGDQRELWAVINGLEGPTSGIHFFTTPGYRTIQDMLPISQARFALRRGSELIVVAAEGLHRVDIPSKQITNTVIDTVSGPLDRQAATLSADASRVFIAHEDPNNWELSKLRAYDATSFEPLTGAVDIDFSISAMVALPPSSGPAAVAVFGRSAELGSGVVVLLDDSLDEIRRDVSVISADAAKMTPTGDRIGVVSNNVYAEYDWTNADEPFSGIVGVPYFTYMSGFDYDVARNRVYVGGAKLSDEFSEELLLQRDGRITYIDLETRTAKQESIGFDISFRKVLYNDKHDSVLLAFPRAAQLETINLR